MVLKAFDRIYTKVSPADAMEIAFLLNASDQKPTAWADCSNKRLDEVWGIGIQAWMALENGSDKKRKIEIRLMNGSICSSTSISFRLRFHPFEWAAAMGWPQFLHLPIELEAAWHQIGNTLTPHQALYGLCAALTSPNGTYDFNALAVCLQNDAMDITQIGFECNAQFLFVTSGQFDFQSFIPPSQSYIYSVQNAPFYVPKQILICTPDRQTVLVYRQHETVYVFTIRLGTEFTQLTSTFQDLSFKHPSAIANLTPFPNLQGAWRIIPVSKWLITMVSKSPKWGYSPYKWPKWLINGGY